MKNKIKDAQELISSAAHGKEKIHNKDYTTVPLRVEVFRTNFNYEDIKSTPNVFTHLKIFPDRVISKTYLAQKIDVQINEEGQELASMSGVMAVGTAEEMRNSSNINKTSAVENAETSSVGRMLANLGLHGGSYASFEEVDNAISNQKIISIEEAKKKKSKDKTQDWTDFKNKLFDNLKKINVKSKSEMNEWYVENESQFEDLKNNDLKNYKILVKDLELLKSSLPKEKGTS